MEKSTDLSKCIKQVEKILEVAGKIKNPKKRRDFLPEWSQVNLLNTEVNHLRELLE